MNVQSRLPVKQVHSVPSQVIASMKEMGKSAVQSIRHPKPIHLAMGAVATAILGALYVAYTPKTIKIETCKDPADKSTCGVQTYVGQVGLWSGEPKGQGEMTYPSGNHCIGAFAGLNDFEGECTYSSGSVYHGKIRNDQFEGEATLSWPKQPGQPQFKGNFTDTRNASGYYTINGKSYRMDIQNGEFVQIKV